MPRIISGLLKNRRLEVPKGVDMRPSLEKTRGMIFDSLNSRFDLSEFVAVDLFAGTGALGFEAYSRGCERVFLVEQDRRAVKQLSASVQNFQVQSAVEVILANAITWLSSWPAPSNRLLFLIDPPYGTGALERVLKVFAKRKYDFTGSIVVIERPKLEESDPGFPPFLEKKAGKSRLEFLEIG